MSRADYADWAQSVATILQYISSGTFRQELHLREIQFVAAFPLPRDADDASIAALDEDVRNVIETYLPETVEPAGAIAGTNLSSAFLQLAYPWLQTTGSYPLLESLEPPDGALVGISRVTPSNVGVYQRYQDHAVGDLRRLAFAAGAETKLGTLTRVSGSRSSGLTGRPDR